MDFDTDMALAGRPDDRDVDGGGCQTCGAVDQGLPECDGCFDARWAETSPILRLAAVELDTEEVELWAATI